MQYVHLAACEWKLTDTNLMGIEKKNQLRALNSILALVERCR